MPDLFLSLSSQTIGQLKPSHRRTWCGRHKNQARPVRRAFRAVLRRSCLLASAILQRDGPVLRYRNPALQPLPIPTGWYPHSFDLQFQDHHCVRIADKTKANASLRRFSTLETAVSALRFHGVLMAVRIGN